MLWSDTVYIICDHLKNVISVQNHSTKFFAIEKNMFLYELSTFTKCFHIYHLSFTYTKNSIEYLLYATYISVLIECIFYIRVSQT